MLPHWNEMTPQDVVLQGQVMPQDVALRYEAPFRHAVALGGGAVVTLAQGCSKVTSSYDLDQGMVVVLSSVLEYDLGIDLALHSPYGLASVGEDDSASDFGGDLGAGLVGDLAFDLVDYLEADQVVHDLACVLVAHDLEVALAYNVAYAPPSLLVSDLEDEDGLDHDLVDDGQAACGWL